MVFDAEIGGATFDDDGSGGWEEIVIGWSLNCLNERHFFFFFSIEKFSLVLDGVPLSSDCSSISLIHVD